MWEVSVGGSRLLSHSRGSADATDVPGFEVHFCVAEGAVDTGDARDKLLAASEPPLRNPDEVLKRL